MGICFSDECDSGGLQVNAKKGGIEGSLLSLDATHLYYRSFSRDYLRQIHCFLSYAIAELIPVVVLLQKRSLFTCVCKER